MRSVLLPRTFFIGTGSALRRWTSAVTPDAALVVGNYTIIVAHTPSIRSLAERGVRTAIFARWGVDARPTYLEPRTKGSPFVTHLKIFGAVSCCLGFVVEQYLFAVLFTPAR